MTEVEITVDDEMRVDAEIEKEHTLFRHGSVKMVDYSLKKRQNQKT